MKSLRLKSLIMILVPVLLIFALVGAYVVTVFHREQAKSATEHAENLALVYAHEMRSELTKASNAANAIADLVSGLVEQGIANRAAVNASLQRMLENNDVFLGVWVGTESYAFDGNDFLFADTPGHDHSGRYIPYYSRDGDNIILEPLEYYDVPGEGDYYLVPFNSQKATLSDPFWYEVKDRSTYMITLSVPIYASGNVIGVAGIDLAIDVLQSLSEELTIYESGLGRLISGQGTIVTHPERELIGTLAQDFQGEQGQQLLNDLKDDQVVSLWEYAERLKTDTLKAFAPVAIEDIDTPWAFSIVVPRNEIFVEVNALTRQLVIITLIGVGLIALAVFVMSGSIVRPIISLTLVLERLAKLDFTYDEGDGAAKLLEAQDEIGIMAKAVAAMQQAVAALIRSLQEMANDVAATSEELSASAEETSASVEEVASSANELSQNVAGNKQSSTAMMENAGSIEELAISGNEQMGMTMNAMGKIVAASQEVKEVLAELFEQAGNMEGILQIISDVAEQTNLLALNAAIEAARAGDHGRGFAVVAEEVRGLAEQTQDSVEDITVMITELVGNASRSAEIMELTENEIASGNTMLNETQKAFQQITERVTVTVQGIGALADAMEDMDGICNAVASASQEQAASTEEVAATAQALAEMGEHLKGLVERFTV
ncbi:MAG: methyl-accepting chemotaxis protein [Firmicutes bacterium]|mgnify:CR=1 FL=1|nr:methyl-accepting chemotaxis protein [Bacillota bacterium]